MTFSVLKLMLFLLIVAFACGVFFASASNFFVSGGSDAADRIFRVSTIARTLSLLFFILIAFWLIMSPSGLSGLVGIVAFSIFLLSQNVINISGSDYTLTQTIAMVPVKTRSLVTSSQTGIDAKSGKLSWCCLEISQSEGTRKIFLGIWPFRPNGAAISKALRGMTLE